MDANHFDAFVKALSLSAARRGMVAGLLGGGLAALLVNLETAARPHSGRHRRRNDDLSAEKRKKHKKKHHKKHKKQQKPPQDEAPPCTEESCPIPPGCSEQVLDDCGDALMEELLNNVAPCQADCEDPDSPACQVCLEPVVIALLPEAEACAVESCSSSSHAAASAVRRHRVEAQGAPAVAREWWVRHCDKPECCYADLHECLEDVLEELGVCLGGVVVACVTTGPLCSAALFACLGKLVYDSAKCKARHGCPEGDCVVGDFCCPYGAPGCGNFCCEQGSVCCNKDHCCSPEETCCGDSCCTADRYCCGGKCCPLGASICDPGSGDDPPACCYPGTKPCHGTCCGDSPHTLCCDKYNGQTYCYSDAVGCPA